MDPYLVVLRLVHIVAATFWVGASIVFAAFIEPTAAALGPGAGPFMGHITQKRRFPQVIFIVSTTAILAGALLYWKVSGGLNEAWVRSTTGTTFTIGAVLAIFGYLLGLTIMRPGIAKMTALAGSDDPSAAAQRQQIAQRLKKVGMVNVSSLVLAAAAMAVARYL